jgi:hypothetical protein
VVASLIDTVHSLEGQDDFVDVFPPAAEFCNDFVTIYVRGGHIGGIAKVVLV